MSEATDAMDEQLRDALARDWNPDSEPATAETVATLASQVATWRGRAAYWRGRAEGMAETVEYLKQRVETLEGGTTS